MSARRARRTTTIATALVSSWGIASAEPAASVRALSASAAASAAGTTSSTTASATDSPPPSLQGLALGVELGEPTSATVAWFADRFVIAGAIGSGTLAGPGLSIHLDGQLVVTQLSPEIALRAGLGGRYYHHGYEPSSTDEIPDSHYGVRGSLAIALHRGPLEVYFEAAPGIDVKRTTSCTLASGANSICPHAMEHPFFLQLVLGARWFLTR